MSAGLGPSQQQRQSQQVIVLAATGRLGIAAIGQTRLAVVIGDAALSADVRRIRCSGH